MLRILILCFVIFETSSAQILSGELQRRSSLANNNVTFQFLNLCAIRTPGRHCVTMANPFLTNVAQLSLFAEERTSKQALRINNLKSKREVRELFPAINSAFYSGDRIGDPMLTADAYTDKDNKFCPAFSYQYNKTFGGTTRVVDYSDPEKAADEINDQVKSSSSDFMDLISSEMIKEGDGINFITSFQLTVKYYKKVQFLKNTTIKFKSGGKTAMFPAAYGEGIIKYNDNKYLDAKTIEIPAEGGIFSYLIIYPNKFDGLLDVLRRLQEYPYLESILSEGKETCAKITVINKDVVTNIDVGMAAKQSNYLRNFFEEGGINLNGATKKCDTYISSILSEVQLKQDIKINPSGYEETKCSDNYIEFKAEHPHIYIPTFTKKALEYRTPMAGVIVDIGEIEQEQ